MPSKQMLCMDDDFSVTPQMECPLLLFPSQYTLIFPGSHEQLGQLVYNWLEKVAKYSGEDPKTFPHPSSYEGMLRITKPSWDDVLQAGKVELMKMAAVWLKGQCCTTQALVTPALGRQKQEDPWDLLAARIPAFQVSVKDSVSLGGCSSLLSVAVIKHHDQKLLGEERVYLPCSPGLTQLVLLYNPRTCAKNMCHPQPAGCSHINH